MSRVGGIIKSAIIAGLAAVPAMAAAQVGATAVPKDEKLICKKIEEIGSLVKRKKVCLTRDQWRRSADGHENYARDLADTLRTKPCGEPSACN